VAKWIFLNTGFIEEEKACLHFRDLSFQRAYGAFDFFRTVGNVPLFLADHLDRFYFSAQQLHLPVQYSKTELETIIRSLIEKNNLPGTGIRLSLTGGYSPDGFAPATPNLLVSQHDFLPPTGDQRRRGITLVSYPYQRQLPQVKSIDYLMAIWLRPQLASQGADDVLYHQNGIVTECPRSNFFLVTSEGTLVTPAENILKGVTRKKLLQLAEKHYPVEERQISLSEIAQAREAFITSTTKQILPVRQIDTTSFGTQVVSNHLQQLLTDATLAE
jgi:D-alanine transaminase/branched-chain amino acid aminotransferase